LRRSLGNVIKKKDCGGPLVVHQNVRFAQFKKNVIEVLVDDLQPDILVTTEVALYKEEIMNVKYGSLKYASSYCRGAKSKRGGGVGIFIQDNYEYKEVNLDDFSKQNVIEMCGIGLKGSNGRFTVILGIYRPPNVNNIPEFLDILVDTLVYLTDINNDIVIVGDINIDLLKQTKAASELMELIKNFNLESHLCEPTRVTKRSKTCIDHIYASENIVSKAEVVKTDVSDHYAQMFCINQITEVGVKRVKIKKRLINDQTTHYLRCLLEKEDWREVISCSDPNECLNRFVYTLQHYYDLACPLKCTETKVATSDDEKWITKELKDRRELIIFLTDLKNYPKFKDVPEEYLVNLKSSYVKDLEIQRKKFNENKVKNSSNINKTAWNIINKEKNIVKRNVSEGIIIQTDNGIECKPERVAELFNSYYIDTPSAIIKSKGKAGDLHNMTLKKNVNSMFLEAVNETEVFNIINTLKNKASSGIDGISNLMLKKVADLISMPLAYVINCSFEKGIFPDALKIGIVKPLYKKGSRKRLENYRPVTLNSSIAKIYEKCFYKRLIHFLDVNSIIAKEQHGFQKGKSTTGAVANALEEIVSALENKKKVAGLFLDLSKAFDCVDHNLLIEKLERYGVRGLPLDWCKTYLSKRKQCVRLEFEHNGGRESVDSPFLEVEFGVPQGSVMGPLFFLVYINNIVEHIKEREGENCKPILYADDSNLIILANSMSDLEDRSNSILKDIIGFLKGLNLVVNPSKTNAMLVSRRRTEDEGIKVKVGDELIEEVDSIKFLGLHLDANLSGSKHTEEVSNKIRSGLFVLKQLSQIISSEMLIKVYYAFIFSHLSYSSSIWGSATLLNCHKNFHYKRRL